MINITNECQHFFKKVIVDTNISELNMSKRKREKEERERETVMCLS